jgi:hypothetical protein
VLVFVLCSIGSVQAEPKMSDERVVFQTKHGDIEFGFYPDVSKQQKPAAVTAAAAAPAAGGIDAARHVNASPLHRLQATMLHVT